MLLAAGGLEAYASADYGENEKSLHNEGRAHDLIRFDDPSRPCWHSFCTVKPFRFESDFLYDNFLPIYS